MKRPVSLVAAILFWLIALALSLSLRPTRVDGVGKADVAPSECLLAKHLDNYVALTFGSWNTTCPIFA